MDDIVAITLFRHGLTEGNKQKVYMGWNDSPLCEETVCQLSSYNLHSEAYDLFISSDLQRCLQTMKLLFPNIVPETIAEFREMHFGSFQGKSYENLKNDENYQLWLKDYHTYSPPKGESFQQFSNRIKIGWEKVVNQVLSKRARHPFIVTHGGVIKYLLSQYAPVEKEFWDWKISHGHGYELRFQLEQLRRGGRCISLQEVLLTGNANG